MSTVARRTVAVATDDGALLHAVVDGSPDAPVTLVLAHGWTLAQAAWDDVAALLAPRTAEGGLRLVRYDQRGHGRSTWGAGSVSRPISIDLLGSDLGTVLDRLAPTGPVVLGGHSMGGMTIMCLAAQRPKLFGDRVRGVALVSTSAGQRLVRDLLYGADATDAMVLAGAEVMHAATVRAFTAFLPALGEHDKRRELAALGRVPVEVLVGDSDTLTPQRHSRQLVEALPAAALEVVPRTGHMLPQERPRLVADALDRLLGAATGDRAAA